jgi:site-specific recombinase XerD
MRHIIRLKHMSYRTEQAYISWVRRFILFHHKRHPAEMGADDIRAFLTHLAVESHVAASTQNGALNALLFLYRHVLKQPFPDLGEFERAKRPRRLPIVFTQEEVRAVLAQLDEVTSLMARLLYGAGLRLMECVRLRVKDLDFAYHQIIIRDGKGAQDRITMLPQSLQEPLQHHLSRGIASQPICLKLAMTFARYKNYWFCSAHPPVLSSGLRAVPPLGWSHMMARPAPRQPL